MDCRTARLLLEFHRPRAGELPPEEAVELERHLACCADCDAAGRTAHRLDDYFGSAIRNVPLPDGLRERLLSRLSEQRGTALRRRLAWTARGLSVAAALLVGTLLWWHFTPSKLPQLDLAKLSSVDGEKHKLRSSESVTAWFHDRHNVSMIAPPFDYDWLIECDMVDVQGVSVPRLVFYHDLGPDFTPVRATVYVLKQEQFDLKALQGLDGTPVDGFSQPVQVWGPRPSDRHDTAFLILFDGDLDKLLPLGRPA
jgi:hypothetical protein